MRRAHSAKDQAVTKRNHREHLRAVHGWPKKPVTCVCDLQANRFRKRDAYDCGRPRCGICHLHKRFGHELTRQEILSTIVMREQILD